MCERPLVTIITPTYNRADFLGQAVESVLAQTYSHFELLVIDDGSTDNTRVLMEQYLKDERVRYLYQENQGQSVARRVALSQARGDFIGFLDSDNVASPERLEVCIQLLRENPDFDVVYGDVIKIDGHGKEISRKNIKRYSGRLLSYMLRDNCVSMNTALARRDCFKVLDENGINRRVADDYEMWLHISAHHQFLYVPQYLAYYRVMDDQISSDKTQRFNTNEAILRDFLATHGDLATSAEARSGWCHFYARKADYLAGQRRASEAIACYARAIKHDPFTKAPWVGLGRLALRAYRS